MAMIHTIMGVSAANPRGGSKGRSPWPEIEDRPRWP